MDKYSHAKIKLRSQYVMELKIFFFFFLTMVVITFVGCAARDASHNKQSLQPQNQNKEIKLTEFILGVGDTLEITVFRNRKSEYFIWTGDTIDLKVYRNDDLNRSIRVGSTGQIILPLIGDVRAAGRSELELRDEIRDRLSKFIIDPHVLIMVTPDNNFKLDDLTMSYKINSTGRIFFPLVGEIKADGISLFNIQQELQKKLEDLLIDPQVIVSVKEVKSQKIMVLGEVNNPGVFSYDSPMTLLEAITKASGSTRDAELSNVVLIRKSAKPTPFVYDLKSTLKEGIHAQNISLSGGDIVYVPEKRIASVSRFFTYLSSILNPVVDLEKGIILWPGVKDVLKGQSSSGVTIQAN